MRPLVVLDFGHGLPDPGAVSAGVLESEVVLAVGFRVIDHLRRHSVDVIPTRMGNQRLVFDGNTPEHRVRDLNARPAIANKAKADLFVSLHVNASGNVHARGAEVYVKNIGSPSGKLANIILTEYNISTGLTQFSRGVKTAEFRVLNQLSKDIPGCLLELEFITNSDARALMVTDAGLNRLAEGVAKGILKALGVSWITDREPYMNVIYSKKIDDPEYWIGRIESLAKEGQKNGTKDKFFKEFIRKIGG